jgi:hypothetical protein
MWMRVEGYILYVILISCDFLVAKSREAITVAAFKIDRFL